MMADEIVPQQQPGEGDGQVRQPIRQEGADGGRDGGDVAPQAQEGGEAVVGREVRDVRRRVE